MSYIDVFNGDADGICALHQLRLVDPVESRLITGVKRDIGLVKHVKAQAGDRVTVLDISFDKNRDEVLRVLEAGASVRYFDHHFAGDIPHQDGLEAYIDTEPNVCTSLLVNKYLDGAYLPWAVTAAYGDNLFGAAEQAAVPLNLTADKLEQLKLLGTCINYNGYGASLDDLIYTPEALYRLISGYTDPFTFIHEEPGYAQLVEGYKSDLESAAEIEPSFHDKTHALYVLPDAKWARRVGGVYANDLAQQYPQRAHAMLTAKSQGGYVVSVRAPLSNKTGADELCRQFDSGGGRKAAAGINHLPETQYDIFLNAFKAAF